MNIGPKIRMISISTNYSEKIKKGIDQDKVFLVTSIDAGTVEVFRKVRGINGFERVLNNLKKYSNDFSYIKVAKSAYYLSFNSIPPSQVLQTVY